MKIKYAHDGVERWELTRGRWANKQAVLKGYEARTWAMNGTILDAKPHEHTLPQSKGSAVPTTSARTTLFRVSLKTAKLAGTDGLRALD